MRLDPSIFGSDAEFRRSAHFSIGKKDILFIESRGGGQFVGDLWKRFIVGEPCDIRANFGQTAQARFWGRKAQRCNYGDIPVIEQYRASGGEDGDRYRKSVRRRILGFQAGKATLVMGPKLVGSDSGVFLRKPLHFMTQCLTRPSTSTLFFREYLLPFFLDWSICDCLHPLDPPTSFCCGDN